MQVLHNLLFATIKLYRFFEKKIDFKTFGMFENKTLTEP